MEDIIRKSTANDRQFMDVDLNKPKRRKNSRELFQLELIKNDQIAVKLGLPFARHAAKEDFEQNIQVQIKAQVKKYGSLEYPEELKVPETNWKQYSDLKNFEVIEEKTRADDNLSNKNPGLTVEAKTTRYQYKDHEAHRYIVMESGPDSIKRAVKVRAILDRQVAGEIEAEEKKT